MADIILGLDLGKRSDYSALVDVYRARRISPDGATQDDAKGRELYRFHCSRLRRWHRGTDYTDIIKDIEKQLEDPRYPDQTYMAVDATGVGGGVAEMLVNAKIPKLKIIPILITAGRTFNKEKVCKGTYGYTVAKYLIASTLQSIFSGRHIRINGDDPLAKTLLKELMDFQIKLTDKGNERFEHRDGEHDDIVLSLGIALWLGSATRLEYLNNCKIGDSAKETARLEAEAKSEAEAKKKQEEDEARKRDEEWGRIDNPAWWGGGGLL